MPSKLPPGLVIAAGTYDGLLAGWEIKEKRLELTFATAVHEGSIRSLSIAASTKLDIPGSLLSCGYDEALRTHDWSKSLIKINAIFLGKTHSNKSRFPFHKHTILILPSQYPTTSNRGFGNVFTIFHIQI